MAQKIPARVRKSVRYVALKTIERVYQGGAYSNLLLNEMINTSNLNEKDSRLFTELVYGTISRKNLLDYYLNHYIKGKKVDNWVNTLLELSIYQLLYLDKIPDHAVIHEAVEIGKYRGNSGVGKFVNGVLRSFQREGIPSLEEIKDPLERLSIEISMPKWLTKKLVQQIGNEETRKLGLSLFEKSRVSGRINTKFITREQALKQLIEDGIEATESKVSSEGIVASKGYLAGNYLFESGCLTIQDESSMLVAPALQIEAHHQVLDACAAPGGKTTHIASFLEADKGGKVVALDIHEHKINLIHTNAHRLKVEDVIQTQKLDAREVCNQFVPESFDRILVDAPCSGLGLMRRKPDIKYNKQPEDYCKLPDIQLAILESVSQTLKHLGILVYSTCTFNREENQDVIACFLKRHPEFVKIDIQLEKEVLSSVKDQELTLYPHQLMTDGFFICCMQKVG